MARVIPIILGCVVLIFAGVLPFYPVAVHADDGTYIVKPGDTLSEIARRYGTDVATLRRLNGLGDIDFVWYGQRLIVHPASGSGVSGEEVAATVEDGATAETMTYVVRSGDTLATLASRFRTTLPHLVELNRIYPGQTLLVGRELEVPVLIHMVASGEHLGTIAARYDTTPRAISRANNLVDPSLLVPGQKLTIVPPNAAERTEQFIAETEGGYHVHTEFPTTTEKWIDVDLSEQRVVAYEGTRPVQTFIVSTGLPGTPTVTGTFRMWTKTPIQDMSGGNRAAGDYYYLEDVQWVQYFYRDYAFHGTYWHNNFGRPMSRGCVNMTNADAKWLFDWASPTHNSGGWLFSDDANPGTLVMVHP